MIYVPNYNDHNCAYLSSASNLRVYDSKPMQGQTISYRDYATDNHYLYRDGYTSFSNYSTLPTCLDDSEITTSLYYRTDFADILLCTFIIGFTCIFLVKGLFNALFKNTKRWL